MPERTEKKFSFKKMIVIVSGLLLIAVALFWGYVQWQTYQAEARLVDVIKDHDELMITERRNYYILSPTTTQPGSKPIIYYPGGLVDPMAYLYKMGYSALYLEKEIYIIKAPFNVAIFHVNAPQRIIDNYALDRVWVGGHSLGGITASRFVANHRDTIAGLFLFGSYSDQNIRDFDGRVISVMGIEDRIINWENYEKAKGNLPSTAILLEIEGLNHSDFGNYGLQKGDGISSFNNEEMIELICSLFQDHRP